ncbi:MAG TPA: fluoride efflux transporter CrcB [Synechococcales cyanobacterium M55_K2018_004]|nr:fluoride efflux transporter CrcB [Synechococcales cyanobacterium M55_K2018_004]
MLKQRIWQQPVVRTVAAISLGAIAGALCRYYFGLAMNSLVGIAVPYSTLVINITGCFAMGFLATLSLGQVVSLHPDVRLLLLTGFLGAYTTFSSYELDSAHLLEQKRFQADLFYWVGSVTLGLMSLHFGIAFAEWLLGKLDPAEATLHQRDRSN